MKTKMNGVKSESEKMKMSDAQFEAAAACILALRKLRPEERLDIVALLAKSLCEFRLNDFFYPDDPGEP